MNRGQNIFKIWQPDKYFGHHAKMNQNFLVPCAGCWLAGLISSYCYTACVKHMQARHKIIQIKLNSRVSLIVMTYACILIFIPLSVVCYSVLLVRERDYRNFWDFLKYQSENNLLVLFCDHW